MWAPPAVARRRSWTCYEKPMDPSVKAEIPPGEAVVPSRSLTTPRAVRATQPRSLPLPPTMSANPSFQVKIDMTVVREVDVTPDKVYLYAVKHGEEHSSPDQDPWKTRRNRWISSRWSPRVNRFGHFHALFRRGRGPKTPWGHLERDPAGHPAHRRHHRRPGGQDHQPQETPIGYPGHGGGRGPGSVEPQERYFGPNQEQPVFVNITANPPQGFAVRSVSTAKHLCRPSIKTGEQPGRYGELPIEHPFR